MYSYRKKIYLITLILLTLLFLVACDLLPKSHDLTVKVTDITGEMLSARVSLLKNGKTIASKTGSTVVFKDLEKGTYQVVGTLPSGEEESKLATIIDSDVVVKLQFSRLAPKSNKVHKFIFEESDNKSFVIEKLGNDEKVIMGVATLNFDTTDYEYGYVDISLERNSSDQSTDIIIKPLVEKNPAYIYREPVVREVPHILSMDHLLRKQENKLLSSIQKDTIPEFKAEEYEVGDQKYFYYQHFATGAWEQIPTTVRAVGNHCIIFVDDTADFYTEDLIKVYVDEFEKNIFPVVTNLYSSRFDLDGNNKLGIVLIDMKAEPSGSQGIVGGYFWGIDFYSLEETEQYDLYSNEGDFIYINTQLLDPKYFGNDFTIDAHHSTIAHEFQHLLYFYRSWENNWLNYRLLLDVEDIWINEAMSTYAENITGYTEVDDRIYVYFAEEYGIPTSWVSLLYWDGILHNYGFANLFTNYIVEQFGEGVIKNIYAKAMDPVKAIEEYAGMNFRDIFMNFIIANKLYSLEVAPEYTYQYGLEEDPVHDVLDGYSIVPFMNSSAVKYYEITGDGSDIKISISGGPAEEFPIGVFIYRY